MTWSIHGVVNYVTLTPWFKGFDLCYLEVPISRGSQATVSLRHLMVRRDYLAGRWTGFSVRSDALKASITSGFTKSCRSLGVDRYFKSSIEQLR